MEVCTARADYKKQGYLRNYSVPRVANDRSGTPQEGIEQPQPEPHPFGLRALPLQLLVSLFLEAAPLVAAAIAPAAVHHLAVGVLEAVVWLVLEAAFGVVVVAAVVAALEAFGAVGAALGLVLGVAFGPVVVAIVLAVVGVAPEIAVGAAVGAVEVVLGVALGAAAAVGVAGAVLEAALEAVVLAFVVALAAAVAGTVFGVVPEAALGAALLPFAAALVGVSRSMMFLAGVGPLAAPGLPVYSHLLVYFRSLLVDEVEWECQGHCRVGRR